MIVSLLFFTCIYIVLGEEMNYKPDIIIMELIKATDVHQNASFNCWLDAVKSLELALPNPNMFNVDLTLGQSFCSVLGKNQQKALALGLTKCHMQESGRSSIPSICMDDGCSSNLNEVAIRRCISDLSQEGFITYTQFFVFTEQSCIKLTGDLFIHQKNEAVRKFEESSRTLHEIISFQQEIYNKMDQQRQVTIDAQDDIDYVMQALVAQRDFVDQQKILISAINHMYDQSGFREISETFDQKKQFISVWGRLIFISVILLMSVGVKINHRVRSLIFFLAVLEATVEHALYHLHNTGYLSSPYPEFFITIMRRYDMPMYAVIAIASFGLMLIDDGEAERARDLADEDAVVKTEMKTLIETFKEQLTVEKEAQKKERKLFRKELLSLKRELNASFSARSPIIDRTDCITPMIGERSEPEQTLDSNLISRDDDNTLISRRVTPSVNLNARLVSNGNGVAISSPLTPVVNAHPREADELKTPSRKSTHKRKRQDESSDFSDLDDISQPESQRTKRLHQDQ